MDLSDIIINFSWQLRIEFPVPGGAAIAAAFSLNEWTVVHGSQTHTLWVKHKLTSMPMEEEKEDLAQKDSGGVISLCLGRGTRLAGGTGGRVGGAFLAASWSPN